jgi:hypothetical protein
MKTVKNGVLEDFVAKVDFETNLEIIRDACEPNTESLDTLFKYEFFYRLFFKYLNKFINLQLDLWHSFLKI